MLRKWCLILAVGILGAAWFRDNYVLLDGEIYSRDAIVLSLPEGIPRDPARLAEFTDLKWLILNGTGLEPGEYETLRQILPDCRIWWRLNFQGRPVDIGTRKLTLEKLTPEAIGLLDYLPRLSRIDATQCRDYDALTELRQRRPDCPVDCAVELGGSICDAYTTMICPESCTAREVATTLTLLPEIQYADLRTSGMPPEEAAALAEDFPQVHFVWNIPFADRMISTDAEEIDLSGIVMEDTRAVEALVGQLPNLKKVIMCDCGISSPEMDALNKRYPDIRFVWSVKLGPLSARTDDTWFAPITHRQLIGGRDADELKYCIDMECIDLGHCWIRDCQWASEMPNLKYLVLADTYVSDLSPLSELKNLAYLEIFVTPVRDYTPLLGCTGLEDLNLGYTYGDPTPISQMTWLRNLWWGGSAGRNASGLLHNALPNTRLMLYSGSSTGLGWRNLPHYYEMRDKIGMYYMTG